MTSVDRVWFNGVNLRGLWWKKPHEGRKVWPQWGNLLPVESTEWWAKNGNDSCEGLGILNYDGYITFASKNKDDVQLWTDGALAVMDILKKWVS